MARILVIGGDGMLGHQLLQHLASKHDVHVTLRRPLGDYRAHRLFDSTNASDGVDVRNLSAVQKVFDKVCPEVAINAAGIVKQRGEAAEAIPSIEINALFPHRLARICQDAGTFLIHYSTDCVFSGRKGEYTEDDLPDPIDLYGRSKLLGEPTSDYAVTLRTSMIGPELSRTHGLLEWFLLQQDTIRGYRRAVFSGLTTLEHARIVGRLLEKRPRPSGLYHVSAQAISKYDLLCKFGAHFRSKVTIVPDETVVINRSLDSTRFRRLLDYQPPTWERMLAELSGADEKVQP